MKTPVIVLNWNGWDDTLACLASLRASRDVDEVWLVDNGSTMSRVEEARRIYRGLRTLRFDVNHGWAGGYNRALAIAMAEDYEWAYLLNNDAIVTTGFLAEVIKLRRSSTRIAAVGSAILSYDDRRVVFDGDYHEAGAPATLNPPRVRWGVAACGAGMLVSVRAVRAVGPFDERFFCYHEETAWCWRAMTAGWKCGVVTTSVVTHKIQRSDVGANARYYIVRNRFLLDDLSVLGASSAGERRRRRSEIVKHAYQQAGIYLTDGRRVEWLAVVSGVIDGIVGRFGERKKPVLPVVIIAFVIYWLARATRRRRSMFRRRLLARVLRGDPGGYPIGSDGR